MTRAIFDDVWLAAAPVKGWFSKGELRVLFEVAHAVAEGDCIVEIGSYAGRRAEHQ